MNKLVHIGFNNFVSSEKVISVLDYASAPAKRLVQYAKKVDKLTDLTSGNKTLSVIVLENDIAIASVKAEIIAERINGL